MTFASPTLASLARASLAAVLALALGGCFQPVNSPRFGTTVSDLQQVSVERIEGYLGYTLKAELDYLLTGGKEPSSGGRYLLKVKTKQSKGSTIVDASTGLAQVGSLQVEAVYVLVDRQNSDKIRTSGKTYASASFDRSQLRFASLRAERDAEERLGKALAERLKIIIATALANDAARGPARTPDLSPDDPDAPAKSPGDES
jgi:LPS-assembly lipoprotein